MKIVASASASLHSVARPSSRQQWSLEGHVEPQRPCYRPLSCQRRRCLRVLAHKPPIGRPAQAVATEPQPSSSAAGNVAELEEERVAPGQQQQQQQPSPPLPHQQPQQPGPPAPESEQQQQQPWLDRMTVGKLACLTVALLWGSYSPALRLVYSMDDPPGPVAIMLFRGVLQAVILLSADAIATRSAAAAAEAAAVAAGQGQPEQRQQSEKQQQQQQQQQEEEEHGQQSEQQGRRQGEQEQQPPGSLAAWLEDNVVLIGGLELGMFNFAAAGIQSYGLQLTSATKAGFLVASTSLLTPALSTLFGEIPGPAIWAGSLVALAGTVLIAADRAAVDAGGPAGISLGDAAILLSALFYSLATVRLSSYARRVPPIKLAAAKSVVLASAAVCTAATAVIASAGDFESLWPGWANPDAPLAWAVLCWSAVGPGALAAFMHAKGQAVVPAAEAQVIFSSTPLWSAAAAWVLLGGEPVSERTWVGGACIVVAGLVASRNWSKDG